MGEDTPAAASILIDFESGAHDHAVLEGILRQTLDNWHCYLPEGWEGPAGDRRFSAGTATDSDLPCLVLAGPVALVPTALEIGLWFLDSHPDYGIVRGRLERLEGEKPYPNDFQAKNILKRPQLLGGAFLLRSVEAGSTTPYEVVRSLLASGLRGCFSAQPFGAELSSAPQPDALEPITEPIHLGPSKPAHDTFRSVPTDSGIGRTVEAGGRHVVFVIPHFAMGGSDKFTLDLARELCREQGLTVSFVSTLSREDAWWSEFAELSDELYPLQRFLTRPDFPRFLRDHILAKQPMAVLVTHSQLGYQLLPFLRSECPGIPFVDYLHIEEMNWRQGGYPALSLQYAQYLDRTMVSSEHLRAWMKERGGKAERISVHTTNIDPDQWNPDGHDTEALRSSIGVAPHDCLILFAGRLVEQKRPRLLAEIVRLLAEDSNLAFHVAIAGDGPEGTWLEEFWGEHELKDRVSMLGQVAPSEMKSLLAAADVFLLPSQNEGIALALYEAMAMRCAVIGADVGGQSELVTEDCGVLVAPRVSDQAGAYAEAVSILITDGGLRDQLSRAARSKIEAGFSLRGMGKRIADLLQQIDSSKLSRPPGFSKSHLNEVIEQFRLEQMLYASQAALRKADVGEKNSQLDNKAVKPNGLSQIFRRLRRKGAD